MKDFLILWANTSTVRHINYHFTQLGEIVDYLEKIFPEEIDILDADMENLDLLQVTKRLLKSQYKAVAMYITTENLRQSINISELIKEISPTTKIIAYGTLSVLLPNFFEKTKIDAIYTNGDQEKAIENYFKYIINNDFEILSGIKLIQNGKLIDTKEGEYIDFNELGFSNLAKLPVANYFKVKNKKRIIITISRGCPYTCPHCLVQMTEGHKDRRRNINKLREYLNKIFNEYKYVKFFSPDFTLDKQYVIELCEMLIKNFHGIEWECTTRMNFLDDENMLKKMSDAGCKQISLGIETINEKELAYIGKKYDVDNLEETIKRVQKYNIKIKACIMLGIPRQSRESIIKTFSFLDRLQVEVRPTIYTPYQHMNKNMTIDEIESYNRKLFHSEVEGVTHLELLKLVYEPKKFKEILDVKK